MMDTIGGLFALILFGAVLLVGGLLLSSHAVLFKEQKIELLTGFYCTYFTGTRVVEFYTESTTGCARFIKVGA